MSEYLQNDKIKQEKLKSIIRDIHSGKDMAIIKKEFARLLKNVSPEEISAMENALIKEGFPPEEIQRLCEVHVSVFDSALKKHKNPRKMPGHPVHTYMQENKAAKSILKTITPLFKRIVKTRNQGAEKLRQVLAKLKKIEVHFQRKENQLFPLLEETGFTGPSKVMWGKHDEIRGQFKVIDKALKDENWKVVQQSGKKLISMIKNMIFMEEKILYPTSLKKLSEEKWIQIRKEEPDIGYAWIKPGNLWDMNLAGRKQQQPDKKQKDTYHLDQGDLTIKQINLLLKNLPIDITFVDENDRVLYYSQGKERIFPRSPAVIGREVQNCHPPKSVHIVNKIIESFKKKEKDAAEFWLTINNRLIYIRYFALYDQKGDYRGVIEVTQDITGVKKLEGERRLLDW